MSERYKSPESNAAELQNSHETKKHHERLQEQIEKSAEKAGKNSQHEKEFARHEVHEHAVSALEHTRPQAEKRQPHAPTTKADKEHSFNTIMHHARESMSKPEKTFSRIIHRPIIEKTSEILGTTVARPSGIIGATIAAFIGLLSIYSIAKFAGFELSGSEMPLLLAGGFLTGILTEWLVKSIRSILFSKPT